MSATGIINLGFSASVPKYAVIKAGGAHNAAMPIHTPALVFWGYAYGGQKGDVLELLINGPKGEVIRHQADLENPKPSFSVRRASAPKVRAGQSAPIPERRPCCGAGKFWHTAKSAFRSNRQH